MNPAYKMALLCGAIFISTAALAADPLGKVRIVKIDYQANVEIEGCKAIFANALVDHGIGVTNSAAQANADLKIKLDVHAGAMRTSLKWGAIVEDSNGNRLYSAFGEESSWTAKAACKDLADDVAEDLQDDIRSARVKNF